MGKSTRKPVKATNAKKAAKAKVSGFVVGRATYTKISMVEGISLSAPMKKRIADAKAKKLSAEETRKAIMRSYRKA